MDTFLNQVEAVFLRHEVMPAENQRQLVEDFLAKLESGEIRCAQKVDGSWLVDERVKKGILLAFRIGQKEIIRLGPLTFIDKSNLFPRSFALDDQVRIVPGSSTVRRGAYLGANVILMPPSYVNIGAFIDEGTLIDSHALVGSCAQIGKRVHVSAGAQIGGVLEPVGACPIIIEDDVLIGGNCGLYEGVEVGEKAVIGAGVIITKSTKIFDLVHEVIISGNETTPLKIPPHAVLVPGTRELKSAFAKEHGISLACPLIIKYRDQKTDRKTEMEDLLR